MQFSIRALLAVILAVAHLCCVFFTLPDWLSPIVLAVLTFAVVPAALVSGVVYGRGSGRAFSIGAITPLACFVVSLFGYAMLGVLSVGGDLFSSADGSEVTVPIKIAFGIVSGGVAAAGFASAAVRWLCLRGQIRDLNHSPRGMYFEPALRRRVDAAPQAAERNEYGEVPREAVVRPR